MIKDVRVYILLCRCQERQQTISCDRCNKRSYYCKMFILHIIYGHHTTSILPKIVRFYGARTAPCPQKEESYAFLSIFRHSTVPGEFRYYFNFTAPARGLVRSLRLKGQWPGTVWCSDGARPAFAHI